MQPPRAIRSCSAVLAAAAAIAALVAAVFGRALRGGFVWDDVTLVERNALVHSLRWVPRLFHSGFWDTSTSGVDVSDVRYYRPLISTAYALQWQLGHGAPWLFHAVSLVLHAACALLGLRWLRARIPAAPAPAVALAALVLVAHPSRTESVAWIAGSTDLWATLFLLLAAGARTPLRCAVYAALATLSMESAAALPVLTGSDQKARSLTSGRVRVKFQRRRVSQRSAWPQAASCAVQE